MTDWREGLIAGAPGAVLERELRYRLLAPLLQGAAAWCDVDGDPAAAEAALGADGTPATRVTATAADVGAVVARARDGVDGTFVVSALAAADDGPELVETLLEVGTTHDATVVVAVPLAAPPAPHGALDELRGLLPKGFVELHQAPLVGSFIAPPGADAPAVTVDAAPASPTCALFVFGPQASAPAPVATVAPADVGGERAHLRGLEADAALVPALRAALADQPSA